MTAEWINELAIMLSKARCHGNVYMDGSDNPLPSELRAAREFVDGLLADERAHADRLADWMSDADHFPTCPACTFSGACDCGLDELLDAHDARREAQR